MPFEKASPSSRLVGHRWAVSVKRGPSLRASFAAGVPAEARCLPSQAWRSVGMLAPASPAARPHYSFLIGCPPNSLRMEDSSLSAKESSSRER